MSKRSVKPKTPKAPVPPLAPDQPANPADSMASYANKLPAKRAALLSRLEQIGKAEQQLAAAKNQAMAEVNELGGEAKAIAAMLGKTIEEVLGMPPGAALNMNAAK